MLKILIAEDDKSINALVASYLTANGYEPICAFDGSEALRLFHEHAPALIITDVMMPNVDGFALAKSVRAVSNTPVLFLTALDDKPSKQLGFTLGVDDYVTKPFDVDELMLRVAAVLRRARIESENSLTVGNLRLDKEEHTAYLDGEELNLTVREFDILYKFLSYPKRTFTRGALMDEFWDYDSSATSRTVDVYVAKLREKTAGCDGFDIVTVHGLGYKAVLK